MARPMQTDTVTVRNAVPGDLPALVALSQKTFTDKFGHLYHPEDLATFLKNTKINKLCELWSFNLIL